MLELLVKYPKLNGAILGLVQGIPQGLGLPSGKEFVFSGLDQDIYFIAAFGLFAPPILTFLSFGLMNYRYSGWWLKISRYINLYYMIIIGSASIGLVGLYALEKAGADHGIGICTFFIAGAVGFSFAVMIENYFTKGVEADDT